MTQGASETRLARAILLLVFVVQAAVLVPELWNARDRNNDTISHFTLIRGMVDAVDHGDNPLDFWSAETSVGVPLARWYQPLSHLAVVAVYFALGRAVSLWTIFLWAHYLAVICTPLSLYFAARRLELPPLAASASALLSLFVSGPLNGYIGFELRSALGFGAFPQTVGTNLLLLGLGLAWRAVREGRRLVLTGVTIGVTLVAHLIYGWIAALCVCVIALVATPAMAWATRMRRVAVIGIAAAAIVAFQLVPIFSDAYLINRARNEPPEKFDSIGAAAALKYLFTGQVLDNVRLPVLSLLALAGIAILLWRYRTDRKLSPSDRFLLGGALFWLLVWFGRPTWGALLMVIGATSDLHLLRTIGALQLFLVLIAGTGLAVLWREAAKRWHWGVAAAATLLLLVPAARERYTIVASLETLGRENTRALDASLATLQSAEALGRRRGGRMYAGLSDSWGAGFLVGYTPVASYLVTDLVPVISGMYNGSSLVNDLIPRFNEANPGDYRLFNIRTMLTPPVASLPAFLKPAADWGKLRAFEAPGEGYFALVDTVAAATVTRETFFSVCDPWMHSPWAANDQHILLDFADGAGKDLPRVTPSYLPPLPPRAPAGRVLSERQSGQRYEAEFEADRPAYVLFRMAWHPNWLVLIDGAPVQTVMLSPGFTGAPVAPGRHRIVCRYAPGSLKLLLLGAGLAVILLLGFLEHHRSDPKPRPGL